MSKIKLLQAVLIAVVTLVLLYAGYFLFGRQTVGKPLQEELQKVSGVNKVEIIKASKGQPSQVKLQLAPTHNLALLYRQVDEITKSKLENYTINITGNANLEAQLLFYQLSLLFYQGLNNGNYVAMQQEMTRQAALKGWGIEVQMDATNAYVVMYKGNKYWYQVINRLPVVGEEATGS